MSGEILLENISVCRECSGCGLSIFRKTIERLDTSPIEWAEKYDLTNRDRYDRPEGTF